MEPRTVQANGIEIAYESFGGDGDPTVLLVMGLGIQMLGWDDGLCAMLVDRGHRVVRFDNRDVGLSTHMHDAPPPDPFAALAGDASSASYRLDDMADDALALLDALGVQRAHVVGASLGGMIAQTAAIRAPERVLSLTSIMSTTGEAAVTRSTPEAQQALMQPPAGDRDGAIEATVRAFRTIGSPGFELDEPALRERAGRSYDRAYDPLGTARQLVAIYASGDRTELLRELRIPTVVIHGAADPLIQLPAGEATAAAIPGAELIVVDGMGHDLPRALWPRIADAIAGVVARGEAASGDAG